MILVEVVSKQGELKIPLAGKGAVAFPAVASPDAEQRDYMLAEAGHLAGAGITKPFRWCRKRISLCRHEGRGERREHHQLGCQLVHLSRCLCRVNCTPKPQSKLWFHGCNPLCYSQQGH